MQKIFQFNSMCILTDYCKGGWNKLLRRGFLKSRISCLKSSHQTHQFMTNKLVDATAKITHLVLSLCLLVHVHLDPFPRHHNICADICKTIVIQTIIADLNLRVNLTGFPYLTVTNWKVDALINRRLLGVKHGMNILVNDY